MKCLLHLKCIKFFSSRQENTPKSFFSALVFSVAILMIFDEEDFARLESAIIQYFKTGIIRFAT